MTDKYLEEMKQRIKKLPERLRNYISKLEKDVAYYRELIAQTEAGQTSVIWTNHIDEKYLPNFGIVRYMLPNGSKLEVSLKEDRIEIRGGDYNETLVILPAYSNTFYATVLKYKQEVSEGEQ